MTRRPCRRCGGLFYPAKAFHLACWQCWRADRVDETARLRDEVETLRRRLTQARPPALDAAAIRWILQLVHPDKHDNSPRSNSVTAALLQMRVQ
jgi:hypothetical protein